MDQLDFTRSKVLNNIPSRKLQEALNLIESNSDSLDIKHTKLTVINRYAEANIPIEYWSLKMEKDFQGDPKLLTKYNEYIADIKSSYINGASMCFASKCGLGKTMTMNCILKKATHKGYACLYTVLSDIVSVLTQSPAEEKFLAKRELSLVDFLVVDEVDNRFFNQSEISNELFARTFESILRTRLQNKLPILMATNSPNIKESFATFFKESLGSLMSKIPIFYVSGEDFRRRI